MSATEYAGKAEHVVGVERREIARYVSGLTSPRDSGASAAALATLCRTNNEISPFMRGFSRLPT